MIQSISLRFALCLSLIIGMTGCGDSGSDKVVIYTNADEEAVQCFSHALDEGGFRGKYILTTFNTSELGGKLLAEGKNIEADIVTQSAFYLDEAQKQKKLFVPISFDTKTLSPRPDYYLPTTVQEGVIFYNTHEIKNRNLPVPKQIRDLASPEYKNHIAIPNIMSSSTAWLMVLQILHECGDDSETVLKGILENAGVHIDASGSGPLKKLRTGEVAIAYGLRQQARADKQAGLPVEFIDYPKGNMSLTEGMAVVDKGENTSPLAAAMVKTIIQTGRTRLMEDYPVPLYEGEEANGREVVLPEKAGYPLNIPLLQEHQKFVQKLR